MAKRYTFIYNFGSEYIDKIYNRGKTIDIFIKMAMKVQINFMDLGYIYTGDNYES